MRIGLFTSNYCGGIVQFAIELYKQLKKMHYDVVCFFPDDVIYTPSESINAADFILYERHNKTRGKIQKVLSYMIPRDKEVKEILRIVSDAGVDELWTVDDAFLSVRIGNSIPRSIRKVMAIHDPFPHLQYNQSIITKVKRYFYRKSHLKYCGKCDQCVFFSEESKERFCEVYPRFRDHAYVVPLGAHIPDSIPEKPQEISDSDCSFYLFFGRFEKYKGIDVAISAFNMSGLTGVKLVIAGDGMLTNTEESAISDNPNSIVLIKKYVPDNQMIWLIKNSRAVVLPYKEASQSGILPIAYSFAVPVIVSNIPGLTQFVVPDKTGIICNNNEDFVKAMRDLMSDELLLTLKKGAKEFYQMNLSWEANLNTFFTNRL